MGHYLKNYSCKESYVDGAVDGAAYDDEATSEVISRFIDVNCFVDLLLQ